MATAGNRRSGKRKPGWKKGESGNPAGRTPDLEMRKTRKKAEELIGPYGVEIIDTLVDVMRHSKSDKARVVAANALADRLWGKPTQRLEHTGEDGADIRIARVQGEIISELDRVAAKVRT